MADTTRPGATVPDQLLDSIRASQEASVSLVRSWAEVVAEITRSVPGIDLGGAAGFSRQLWESERQYAIRLLEAMAPVVPAPAEPAAG